MSDDWREFLKEVHEQNRQQMELSKQREQNVYMTNRVKQTNLNVNHVKYEEYC